MRIVIRVGGSVVASPANPELISRYADVLKEVKALGHEVAVVVGGGELAREFIGIARQMGLDETAQDDMAISVSKLYAQLLLKKLGRIGCKSVSWTLEDSESCLSKGRVAVMGGLKPGITTDAVAALLAEKTGADLLVKGTNQEGVYDKDPKTHKDAIMLEHLSLGELSSVLVDDKHKAGIHQIIDPEAVKVLKRYHVKVVVVNGYKPENVLLAIKGKRVGTLIE
jgi:uridylate kinase